MWIAIVGEIWKQRNNIIFNNSRPDPIEMFTMAQLKSWSWITGNGKGIPFEYVSWCMEQYKKKPGDT